MNRTEQPRIRAGRSRRRVVTLAVVVSILAATPIALQGTAPALEGDAEPTPSVSPTPDPTPEPSPSPSPEPSPSPSPSPSEPPDRPGPVRPGTGPQWGRSQWRPDHPPQREDTDDRPRKERSGQGSSIGGTFSTEALDRAAKRLRAKGASDAEVARMIYRPFIVEGPAAWSDSWHAPRYVGGFHLHEGQDVLCRSGAPVLAATRGRLEYGENSLGGLVAYVRQADGGFLYYAHLSAFREGWAGRTVEPGDRIGSCGATGNATVPHVHFGIYGPDGGAINPMRSLVSWLRRAERRAGVEHEPPSARPLGGDAQEGPATPLAIVPLANVVDEPIALLPNGWTGTLTAEPRRPADGIAAAGALLVALAIAGAAAHRHRRGIRGGKDRIRSSSVP